MKATMTTTTLAALTVALFQSTADAATRVWTDTTGKTIEAEQVKLMNEQVVLRLVDGREIRVSLDSLSEADRREAMLSQPPKLDLKVSAKTNRSNSSARDRGWASRIQIQEETTTVSVNVIKQSSAPYEEPLKAVLYVMGERGGDQNAVLEKVSAAFTYAGQEKEFTLSSNAFESVKRQDGDRRASYKGWLIAVIDSNGEIVAMKSSRKEYERNAETLLEAESGAVLSAGYETVRPGADESIANRRRF